MTFVKEWSGKQGGRGGGGGLTESAAVSASPKVSVSIRMKQTKQLESFGKTSVNASCLTRASTLRRKDGQTDR